MAGGGIIPVSLEEIRRGDFGWELDRWSHVERISSQNVEDQLRERLLQWVKIIGEELDTQK